jgi:hypothetical protein
MSQIWYGLALSLVYPSGDEGGNFLVQMISTCLRYAYRKGGGGLGTLWAGVLLGAYDSAPSVKYNDDLSKLLFDVLCLMFYTKTSAFLQTGQDF